MRAPSIIRAAPALVLSAGRLQTGVPTGSWPPSKTSDFGPRTSDWSLSVFPPNQDRRRPRRGLRLAVRLLDLRQVTVVLHQVRGDAPRLEHGREIDTGRVGHRRAGVPAPVADHHEEWKAGVEHR